MNEYEKMIKGLLYNPSNQELNKIHLRGLRNCQRLNKVNVLNEKKKQRVLAKAIPSSKNHHFGVFTPMYFEYGINIHLGDYCYCNYGCTFLDVSPITLGDYVWIGANTTLATPMHPLLSDERIYQNYPDGFHDLEYSKPIVIKDHVWIASNVTICGGVTIGENSVIASGAVVTKDIPANVLAGGVPAKVIRPLTDEDKLNVWQKYQNEEKPNK